jgi:hypothetical protein
MSDAIRYAMIRNGVVENVSLWDGDTSRWQPPAEYLTIPAPDHVGRDWLYDGVDWVAPIPVVIEEVPVAAGEQ